MHDEARTPAAQETRRSHTLHRAGRRDRRGARQEGRRSDGARSPQRNPRQVQAIADAVREALAKQGTKPSLVEGADRGEWILIDYFDFIVHVFTPATREFYGLERLWGDAERIEIPA
jgi:hypothetical protein